MKTKNIALCGLGLGLLFSACSSENAEMNEPDAVEPQVPTDVRQIELTGQQKKAVSKTNDITFGLFENIIEKDNSQNQFCLSPLSYLNALSIVANGASDETVANILRIFNLEGESQEVLNTLNETCKEFAYKLPYVDNKVSFSMTNSLWIGKGLVASNSFTEILENNYDGKLVNESPAGAEGLAKVNEWVNKHTQGMIPNFLDSELKAETLLLNTVYFNGEWGVTFDENKTRQGEFKNVAGEISKAEFMETELSTLVNDVDGLTMVSLPFGNGSYVMSFVKSANDPDFSLSNEAWNRLSQSGSEQPVKVVLPKFDISYKASLYDAIEDLYPGSISNTFFSKILTGNVNLKISDILHKTKISIDEKKCEGAAATGVIIDVMDGPGSVDVPLIREIRFDRPFYFVLHEKTTGAVLFLGKVAGF